jgi:predicted regulator of amino acid metabolism with ACT domain
MAKSKYSRLSPQEAQRLVERALKLKRYDPEMDWTTIAKALGVNRQSLREMVQKYEPKQEGNSDDANAKKVERVSRR